MRVVVTRAASDAGALTGRLIEAGFDVVEVATIAIAPPADERALVRTLERLEEIDWIVVTSRHGAARLVEALGGRPLGNTKVAAVGPGTADVVRQAGLTVALVPERFVAEGLLEVFPAAGASGGTVVVAQGNLARPVVTDGIRRAGWNVIPVEAYRTVAPEIPASLAAQVTAADAIAFTSASTVHNFVAALGVARVPARVACIGPVTAAAAAEHDIAVTAVAVEHTIDGLVDALLGCSR